MFWRLSLVLLTVTVSVPLSNAQMRGTVRGYGTHAGFAHGTTGRLGPHHETRSPHRDKFPGSSVLYPELYSNFYPNYDPNYDPSYYSDEQDVDERNSPQVVIVRPAAAEDSPRKNKPGSLLIEWQGDRYVRFGGTEETEGRGTSAYPDYAEATSTKLPMSATKKERTESSGTGPAPVVLVYRDGHREEIPDYAIANGVIYAHGNYWQNGYWTKQIPLSKIDPPATMHANQERGVKFMLPSAPNVVIASF